MKKGTLVLKTDGGERKMSYTLVDGIYYMSTKSHTKKVAQIKANNQVSIDLDDISYTATLIAKGTDRYSDTKSIYLSTMPKLQQFVFAKIFGRKNDMFIMLQNTQK